MTDPKAKDPSPADEHERELVERMGTLDAPTSADWDELDDMILEELDEEDLRREMGHE